MMVHQNDVPPEVVRLKRPKKHYIGRIAKFLLSAFAVAAIGGAVTSARSTYEQCLSAKQNLWISYLSYGPAIYGRIANIALDVFRAKSIDNLRTLIADLPREEAFKDKSLLDLEVAYAEVLGQMSLENTSNYAELYKEADDELRRQPEYVRLMKVFFGEVPSDFTDDDLPKLQIFAAYVSRLYIDYFFKPFRTVYIEGCTISDIFALEFGGQPKIIRAKLTTFEEFEQDRLNRLKANPPPTCLPPCVPNL